MDSRGRLSPHGRWWLLRCGGFLCYCFLEIIQRHSEAGFELNCWFPAEKLPSFRDVGTALFGIVLREWFVTDLAFRSCHFYYVLRAFENGEFVWIADVYRQMFRGFRETKEAVDLVADIAEATGLAAIAVDREVFTAQSLLHEVGDDASVVQLHARAVGVEDADDARIHFVITVIGHGDGLGEALGFVVDRTRSDGIHVAPVSFFLGMFQGIAVALRGGRDEIFRAVLVGDIEGVKRSER